MVIQGAVGEPLDAGEDVVGGLGLDKRLRLSHGEIAADGRFQGRRAAVGAAADALVGHLGEQAFGQVQPRRVGRGEVHLNRGRLASQARIIGVLCVP